jgi:hypothetical protein
MVLAVGSHLSSIEEKWEKLEEIVPGLSKLGEDPSFTADDLHAYVTAKIQSMNVSSKG